MYAKSEVRCSTCGRIAMVDTEELRMYDMGCCNTTMQPTGTEEYDDEYARDQNRRSEDAYNNHGGYDDYY